MVTRTWKALPIAILAALPAFAQEGAQEPEWRQGRLYDIKTDKLSLKPTLTDEIVWDTNVFLREPPTHSRDIYIVTEPGLAGDFNNESSGTQISAGYRYRIKNYNKLEDENAQEDHANGSIGQKLGDLRLDVYDRFDETTNPIDIQAFPLQDFDSNDLGGAAVYNFNKFDGEIGHSRKTLRFDPQQLKSFDQTTDRTHGGVAWHAWPKTDVLGEFAVGRTDFEDPIHDDSDWYEVLAGLRGNPTSKITVTLKTGLRNEDYDDDSGTTPFADDYVGAVIRGSLSYDWTPRDLVRLTLLREPIPSTASNFFIATRAGIDYSRVFSARWKAGAGLFHEVASESDSVPDNERTGLSADTSYDFTRWMTGRLAWEYQGKKNDTGGGGDYKRQMVTMSTTVRF